MKGGIAAFALGLGLLAPGAATAVDEAQSLDAVSRIIEHYIRPGFDDFSNQAERLTEAIPPLCAKPSPGALLAAQEAFRETAITWGMIEFVRLGPLSTDNRAERILFWPDRRSLGLRQVQRTLAEKDQTALSPATLYEKSVALQGLGALEFLLFGTGSEILASSGDGFRCGFARAISENLRSIAGEVAQEWRDNEGIAGIWLNPSRSNPDFRSATESLGEAIGTLTQGLELIRDQRLAPIVQVTDKPVNPKRGIFWRSDMTIPLIRSNFAGLRALATTAEIGGLLPDDEDYLERSADFEFANADRTLVALNAPLEILINQSDSQDSLRYVLIVANSLLRLFEGQIAAALDLPAGFSLTDGD